MELTRQSPNSYWEESPGSNGYDAR